MRVIWLLLRSLGYSSVTSVGSIKKLLESLLFSVPDYLPDKDGGDSELASNP